MSDDMLMIEPPPRARIRGTAYLMHSSVPRTLIAIVWSHAAMSMSAARATGPVTPALFTRMSGPPPAVSNCANSAATDDSSLTSAVTALAPISAATRESRVPSRPAITTCAPAATKRRAIAAPMPVPPPVTSATRPSSARSCVTGGSLPHDVAERRDQRVDIGARAHQRYAAGERGREHEAFVQQRERAQRLPPTVGRRRVAIVAQRARRRRDLEQRSRAGDLQRQPAGGSGKRFARMRAEDGELLERLRRERLH